METIHLNYPVTIEGAEIKCLKMRRPKVSDQLASDKAGGSSAEKEVRLFANLCEVTPELIADLDMSDYAVMQKVYTGFLSPARKK